MNIAIVSAGLSTKSGLRAPVELAKSLQKLGHQVTFYAPVKGKEKPAENELVKNGVSLTLIKESGILNQILSLKNQLKKNDHDIISAHCFFSQLFAARLAGPPIVWTYYGTQLNAVSDHVFPSKPLWLNLANWFGNWAIRVRMQLMIFLADEITALSKAAAKELEKLYHHKPLATILLGSAPESFTLTNSKGKEKKKLTLLSVSRITPYKGFHKIIKAVNNLAQEVPDIELHIVGSAPLPKYLAYLKKLAGMNVNIKLNVSDQDLVKLYQQADVYVTADKYVFFGLPIWEAAAMRLPTVAMNFQAATEAVIHGKTGYLADNKKEFTKYLKILLTSPEKRKRFGEAASKHAAKHSWEKAARAYEDSFSQTLMKLYKPLIPPDLLRLVSNLTTMKHTKLADLGSDRGMNLRLLDKVGLLGSLEEIVAIDRHKPQLNGLVNKCPNIKDLKSDITHMHSISNNSFDLILCTQVIEHIKDREKAMKEMKRILKPGGKLFISSVAKRWYGLYWHRNRKGKIVVHPDHEHEFASIREFTKLIESSSLKVTKAREIPGNLPLLDYALRFRNLFLGKSSAAEHRGGYLKNPRLIRWKDFLSFLPLPGYSIVEAVAKKQKKTTQ